MYTLVGTLLFRVWKPRSGRKWAKRTCVAIPFTCSHTSISQSVTVLPGEQAGWCTWRNITLWPLCRALVIRNSWHTIPQVYKKVNTKHSWGKASLLKEATINQSQWLNLTSASWTVRRHIWVKLSCCNKRWHRAKITAKRYNTATLQAWKLCAWTLFTEWKCAFGYVLEL